MQYLCVDDVVWEFLYQMKWLQPFPGARCDRSLDDYLSSLMN